MMWRTHVLGGLSALWLLEAVPGAVTGDSLPVLTLAAALGALLPDLDAGESKIKSLSLGGVRPFAPLSIFANRAWGHRGLLHSWVGLVGMGLIALPLAPVWGWQPSVALWLGYASHLALDACTRTGLPRSPLRRMDRLRRIDGRRYAPRFHPQRFQPQRFHLLPPSLRVVTGSPEEGLVLALLAAAVLWLLFRHFPAS